MSKPITTRQTTFDTWRQNTNVISDAVGDIAFRVETSSATTAETANLADHVGETIAGLSVTTGVATVDIGVSAFKVRPGMLATSAHLPTNTSVADVNYLTGVVTMSENFTTTGTTSVTFILSLVSAANDLMMRKLNKHGDTVAGEFAVTGTTTLNILNVDGNTTLGNASGDTITINGSVSQVNSTESSSTVTGATILAGGIGIAKNAYVGGDLVVTGATTLNGNTTIGDAGADTLTITPNAVTWSNPVTHSNAHTFSGAVGVLTLNKVTVTAPATGSTLTIADGKALTASNTLTFTGTDSSSVAFGAGGTVAYVANKLSVFAATTSAELAGVISDETGSGVLVFGTAPTITTSIIAGGASFDLLNTTATTINFGGAATTFNAGNATTTQTMNLATGVTSTGQTKTINIGTGGAAGSTTNLNIGSAVAGTAAVNGAFSVAGISTFNNDINANAAVNLGSDNTDVITLAGIAKFTGKIRDAGNTDITNGVLMTATSGVPVINTLQSLNGTINFTYNAGNVNIETSGILPADVTFQEDVTFGTDEVDRILFNSYIDGPMKFGTLAAAGVTNDVVPMFFSGTGATSALATGTNGTLTYDGTGTYRSAEFHIQCTNGTNYFVTKIMALFDGTNTNVTEYGTIRSGAGFATLDFSIEITGGSLVVSYTGGSGSGVTTTKILATAFRA